MARRWPWLALVAYAALLAAAFPAWPDDWDGIGFVASISDFDLSRFHPHPPGYPVYVALLRVAVAVTRSPWRACELVAVSSGVATMALAWDGVRARRGALAAWAAAGALAATPLVFRACSGVGSEAPALAFVALGAWGLTRDSAQGRVGPLALGLAVGLGLGVRLSWAPIYVALLLIAPRGVRARTWAGAAVATLGWLLPLLAIVGPAKLLALYETHFSGHAERWGGTVLTEPGARRIVWLARDVFVDGLGMGSDALGLAIAVLLAAVAFVGLRAWGRARWRGWRVAVVVVAPYLVWVALGQNLRDQPRHVLPLVAMLAVTLGFVATTARGAAAAVASLVVAMSARTVQDAHARATVPPPGQQLVALARAQARPNDLAVFGVSSARFFEGTELADHAFAAGALGDVQLHLTRLDRLPSRVWVTSEVDASSGSPWPLVPVATLCRPARIDRRAPCLEVREWRLPLPGP